MMESTWSEDDKRFMKLAVQARSLGSLVYNRGTGGGDMGAVLVSSERTLLTHGCARSLIGSEDLDDTDSGRRGSLDAESKPIKRAKHSGKSQRIDIHAEMDALSLAASKGLAVKGATCYVTGPPCQACLPMLCAAGIAKIVYVGKSLQKHCGGNKGLARMLRVSNATNTELMGGFPMPKYEAITRANRTLFRDDADKEHWNSFQFAKDKEEPVIITDSGETGESEASGESC